LQKSRREGRDQKTHRPTHAEAQLCHTYAGRRRRSAHHPVVVGPSGIKRHDHLSTSVPASSARRRQPARSDPASRLWRKPADGGPRQLTRPPWEVADVIRRTGSKFFERYRQSLTWAQVK